MIDNSEIKQHLKNTGTWLRLFYMFLFIIFMGAAINIFGIILIFQMLLNLFTGEPNRQARVFSTQLSRYMYQVLLFLGYATDDRPFPFSDWPAPELELDYDTSLPTSIDED